MLVESCEAIAFGNLYHLPFGYPALTIANTLIYGFLLSFTNPTILQLLDEYEKHDPQDLKRFLPGYTPKDHEYTRQEIEVFDLNQHSIGLAWAYVMTAEQIDLLQGVLIPSGKWSRAKNNPQPGVSDYGSSRS